MNNLPVSHIIHTRKPLLLIKGILAVLTIIIIHQVNVPGFCATPGAPPALIDEERSFWEDLLLDSTINNKNLFYAGYIAYKDRLCDLSIESFNECIKSNTANSLVKGISAYYIGKNLFLLGKYEDAAIQFSFVLTQDMKKFEYLKFAAQINTAVTYHRLDNMDKFRETLQRVIETDSDGKYRKMAEEMLSQ